MKPPSRAAAILRRAVLRAGGLGLSAGVASVFGLRPSRGATGQESVQDAEQGDLIARIIGGPATPSARIHLQMPAHFSNGFSVPMTLSVDSPMTELDHVRRVHVLAPRNPIVPVATFHFTPQSGRAMISTRIRLAGPQHVIAVAEMSDGALLKTRTWVDVDTDGCT